MHLFMNVQLTSWHMEHGGSKLYSKRSSDNPHAELISASHLACYLKIHSNTDILYCLRLPRGLFLICLPVTILKALLPSLF